MKIETGKADPDQLHYQRHHSSHNCDSHRGHSRYNTGIDAATTEAAHDNLAQPTENTATDLTMVHHTSHIANLLHIAALWVINPEITVGHIHNHPTVCQGMNCIDQVHIPVGQEEGHILRRT